jgi:hypothetical protein
MGAEGTPSEPTIDDNVIGHTSQFTQGIGIAVNFFAEPRIIANDIYLNGTGIEIDPPSQPSILSNNINYNEEAGIRCFSPGASKRVVIQGNHIHSNTGPSGFQSAGIYVSGSNPMITHNNVTQNRRGGSFFPDIDYSTCIFPMLPTISVNIYDFITGSIPAAPGQYNSTAAGGTITP